jgi:flavin reductase (DIM6/NTAB) family NADH-FMN oxidoreductase RutF
MTVAAATTPQVVDQKAFRDVVGRFTSGVTVITTAVDGQPYGTTASAMSSLSMDPPMLLVCLNKSSETGAAVLKAQSFAVNILADGQEHLAGKFAVKGPDKFSGVPVHTGLSGSPLLDGNLATIECRTVETVTGGTHTVFLAEVLTAEARELSPLTYFRGRFGRLEQAKELEAYRTLRDWVLTRQAPTNQPLDLPALVDELRIDAENLSRALVKLSLEKLVTRRDDGSFVSTPITVEVTDRLFDARCVIQVGIADGYVRDITDEQIGRLRELARHLQGIVNEELPDLARFLEVSHRYHTEFVGLSGCDQLVDAYTRLGISGLWRNAIADLDWWNRFDIAFHQDLTVALADRAPDQVKRHIYRHNEHVKAMVRRIIDDNGGQI